MADILVTSPFQPFTLPTQFKALFNGYIYCGAVDAVDPSVSQVQVYLVNEAGDKVPVAQPLRTNAGGYLVYNGQPAKFVTDSNHSLLVLDSFHSQVWYAANIALVDPEAAMAILGAQIREALRRSYAEAGYALVAGSLESGGILTAASDVLLHEASGKAFSGAGPYPQTVPAGTPPSSPLIDRSNVLLSTNLALPAGAASIGTSAGITVEEALANTYKSNGASYCARKRTTALANNIAYHVIRIPKGVGNVSKEYPNTPYSSATGLMLVKPSTLAEYAKKSKSMAISNAEAFSATGGDGTGVNPQNMQISNGVAYQNFPPVSGDSHNRYSVIVQKDGSTRIAAAADGKTAQQYVDEGADCCFGWHYLLVKDGVAFENVSGDSEISARTCFCVFPNGDYGIIQVQGKSGVYGMRYLDMQQLCIAEGVQTAIALDGGGSTQLLWDGVYLQPSADGVPRPIGGGLVCVNTPVAEFDSGWIPFTPTTAVNATPVPIMESRQIGKRIYWHFLFDLLPSNNVVNTWYDICNTSQHYQSYYRSKPGTADGKLALTQGGGAVGTVNIYSDASGSLIAAVNTGMGQLIKTTAVVSGTTVLTNAFLSPSVSYSGSVMFYSRYTAEDFG